MDIYSKLSDLEHKYEDIVHELSLEGAANDTKRLEPIVSTYSKYKQNKDLEAESLEILSTEKDPDMIAMAKEELSTARANMTELENELKILLIPKDPNDDKNIIVEIRAGAGGEEAALFANSLYRMYSHFAEKKGWQTELLSFDDTGIGGMKEGGLFIFKI